jgi:hypothetical protein
MANMSKCGGHFTTSPIVQFSKDLTLTPKCWGELHRNTWCQSKGIAWLPSHLLQSLIEPGRGEMV